MEETLVEKCRAQARAGAVRRCVRSVFVERLAPRSTPGISALDQRLFVFFAPPCLALKRGLDLQMT
jgi:hypothetical protein